MKICYLCPDSGIELSKYNGSAAHVRGVVESFVELGHDVTLLMSRTGGAAELGVPVESIPGAEFARSLSGLLRHDAATHDRTGTVEVLRALRRIWCNSAVERALEDQLGRRQPDLVYERYSPFGVAGAVVAARLGVPHVLEVNAPLAWEGARHRGQALNDAAEVLERLSFAATTRIIAVSDELREHLIAAGVDAAKICVVPNGVDERRFGQDGPRKPAGLGGEVVAGFVGSLKVWHGVDVLADAFRRAAADPSLHLLVVGDGPMAEGLRTLRDELPGRVTLTGAVHPSRVPDYMRSIDIAVAPYPRLERFYFSPLKVLEYMASGTAVVASRIGQVGRIVEDGRTGLLLEPGDAAELARALLRLANDAPLRTALGRRARDEVTRRHTWLHRTEQIVEQCEALA